MSSIKKIILCFFLILSWIFRKNQFSVFYKIEEYVYVVFHCIILNLVCVLLYYIERDNQNLIYFMRFDCYFASYLQFIHLCYRIHKKKKEYISAVFNSSNILNCLVNNSFAKDYLPHNIYIINYFIFKSVIKLSNLLKKCEKEILEKLYIFLINPYVLNKLIHFTNSQVPTLEHLFILRVYPQFCFEYISHETLNLLLCYFIHC